MPSPKTKTRKISDYHFDEQNINKGSEFGTSLLHRSISETGMGRSALVDKNNVLIAGNKTMEAAAQLGIEEVIEVETNGRQLVVVKRMDLDINTPIGAKAKILDNTVSKHNYREDAEVVAAIVEVAEISNLNDYGLSSFNKEEQEVSFLAKNNVIKITFNDSHSMEYAMKDINYLVNQKYPGAIVTAKGL
ncbi:MAG: hypothetical protein H7Y42_12380 [Chitinophagaceae bacterium]|nr:hypothetical protein [Chitinophagaceae bacterium]